MTLTQEQFIEYQTLKAQAEQYSDSTLTPVQIAEYWELKRRAEERREYWRQRFQRQQAKRRAEREGLTKAQPDAPDAH